MCHSVKGQIFSFIVLVLMGVHVVQLFDNANVKAQELIVIPDEAIRLRILANSDSEEDQALKRKVRDAVNAEITTWVEHLTSLEEARTLIDSRIQQIETIAKNVVEQEGSNQDVHVDFRNVHFPTKIYGNFVYPAGEYEAILITLGNGQGANWWCVLFPPLCFLDFTNGDALKQIENEESAEQKGETTSSENIQVKSFLMEWITKLLK